MVVVADGVDKRNASKSFNSQLVACFAFRLCQRLVLSLASSRQFSWDISPDLRPYFVEKCSAVQVVDQKVQGNHLCR